jgi:hypothetical protein
VRIENIKSWRGVCFYVGKYLAKMVAAQIDGEALSLSVSHILTEGPGRWGVFGKDALPYAPLHSLTQSFGSGKWFFHMRRCAAKMGVVNVVGRGRFRGFTVYSDAAARLYEWFSGSRAFGVGDVTFAIWSKGVAALA